MVWIRKKTIGLKEGKEDNIMPKKVILPNYKCFSSVNLHNYILQIINSSVELLFI